MKCRIRYCPVLWSTFNRPNPAPWRLDVPCVFQSRSRHDRGSWPVQTDFATFAEAVAGFQRVLALVNEWRRA
jgi:hypothetical protein